MTGGIQITPRTAYDHVTGLKPDTTYHYRLVATNVQGVTHGTDATMTTTK